MAENPVSAIEVTGVGWTAPMLAQVRTRQWSTMVIAMNT